MTKRQRAAFTLVELLVVITIIAMLVAIVVPATMQYIAEARKVQCINRERELCMALIQYDLAKGRYPGYKQYIGNRNEPVSWGVVMLDRMGQKELHSKWENRNTPINDLRFAYLSAYVCPSDQRDRGNSSLSYVVNGGQPDSGNPPDLKDHGVFDDLTVAEDKRVVVSSSDIASKPTTVLTSENLQAGLYGDPNSVQERSLCFLWWPGTARNGDQIINLDKDEEIGGLSNFRARPSSNHLNGAVFGFADNRVQFILDDLDYVVYCHLMIPRKSDQVEWGNQPQANIDKIIGEDDIPYGN